VWLDELAPPLDLAHSSSVLIIELNPRENMKNWVTTITQDILPFSLPEETIYSHAEFRLL
jgi:hypothetical protein